jgi:hypothetical protein
MILMVAIEDPVAPEIVTAELEGVVCVLPTAIAPPVKVCWALTVTGSNRVTKASANRLNFRPAERRVTAETELNDAMATPHAKSVQTL